MVTAELLRFPNALHLLTVIAFRARFTDEENLEGLRFGQAFIGDHDAYGLSRTEDRNARRRLEKWGLAHFEGSPKGTVATLLDSRAFSLTDERDGVKTSHLKSHQLSQRFSEVNPKNGANVGANVGANARPSPDQRQTTNQNVKNGKHGQHEFQGVIEKVEMTEATVTPATGATVSDGFQPASIDQVREYAGAADIPLETADAWWHASQQAGFKINGRSMHRWQDAFQSWAQVDAMKSRPRADQLGNKKFWAWIDASGYPHAAAVRFVQYNERKGWKRVNRATGRAEPIFDYKKAFTAFYGTLSEAEVLNMTT